LKKSIYPLRSVNFANVTRVYWSEDGSDTNGLNLNGPGGPSGVWRHIVATADIGSDEFALYQDKVPLTNSSETLTDMVAGGANVVIGNNHFFNSA